jgi:hypothetical protein
LQSTFRAVFRLAFPATSLVRPGTKRLRKKPSSPPKPRSQNFAAVSAARETLYQPWFNSRVVTIILTANQTTVPAAAIIVHLANGKTKPWNLGAPRWQDFVNFVPQANGVG